MSVSPTLGLDKRCRSSGQSAAMDIQAIFDRAGGGARLAARLGIPRTTVLYWRTSGYIPGHWVVPICNELSLDPVIVLALVRSPEPRRAAA